jgi:hypothetical protein
MAVIHIDDILILKATLSDTRGNVAGSPCRVIAMPKAMTLYDLAEMITAGFGFELDHTFGFYDNIASPPHSREAYEMLSDMRGNSGYPGVKKTRLFRVFTDPGKKMLFLFDYEAGWRFIVELVDIEPCDPGIRYPKIVESRGIPPRQYPLPEMKDDNDDNDNA